MKTIYGDLTEIEKGIICQQVNCKNAYGAGLSGALAKNGQRLKQNTDQASRKRPDSNCSEHIGRSN